MIKGIVIMKKIIPTIYLKQNFVVIGTVNEIVDNKFTTGVFSYALSNRGIDWAFCKNNKALFTKDEIKKITHIKTQIILNKIPTSSKEAKS